MTLARSKEFAINQGMFHLICKSVDDMNRYHEASVYDEVLEPDDDFRRAISMDEFIDRALVMVEKVHKKYTKK